MNLPKIQTFHGRPCEVCRIATTNTYRSTDGHLHYVCPPHIHLSQSLDPVVSALHGHRATHPRLHHAS